MSTAKEDDGAPPERQGTSNVRRAYRGYQAYSWSRRITNLWGWLTAQSAGSVAIGTTAVAVIAGTTGLVISDAHESQRAAVRQAQVALIVPDKPAVREVLGRDAVVYGVRGLDSAGRFAEFDVIVLARDFNWVKGSAEAMERANQVLEPAAFQRNLTEAELGARLASATDLIAVGLASAEGERATEETRAAARARHIANALATATKGSKTIWTLNLGQYTGGANDLSGDGTDWQRPILIIGLRSAAADVRLQEALASAMNGTPNLPKTASYSKFELARAK
jgi:hypothetical protein